MGAIGGMLGTAGGAAGTGFARPEAENIVNPVTADQLSQANTGVQGSLGNQQALLQALQGQNGIGNQSQVYNQLQGIANGTGPNPALAQLNNTTGQNVANQAALMAGQRGASSNVGLMARQAGQVGGNLQQQAVGQGAALQAQQQMNAINSAGGIAGQQVNNQVGQTNANTSAQQAYQQNLLNAQGQYNASKVGMQSNINNVNGQLANTMLGAQQQLIGGAMQGAGMAMMAADGGEVPDTSTPTFTSAKSGGGGAAGMISKLAPMAAMAAEGGDTQAFDSSSSGPKSKFGQFLKGTGSQIGGASADAGSMGGSTGGGAIKSGMASLGQGIGSQMKSKPSIATTKGPAMAGGPMDAGGMSAAPSMMAAKGGEVPIIVSPGEKILKPNEVNKFAKGGDFNKVGKIVPGTPKYKGNNYANDVVPTKEPEGSVIIPNNIMQSKDPARGAADFVNKILAKRRNK